MKLKEEGARNMALGKRDEGGDGFVIDVFSDVVCPWCYIGERRLERALELRPELRVVRHWQPFQLRPELPSGGEDWNVFMHEKFGGAARARAMFAHVTQIGATEGIAFAFDRVASAPNTTDAHRLILLARRHNREWEAANALFAAYFEKGRNLNERDELVAIMASIGLDAEEVSAYLLGNDGHDEVVSGQQLAAELGIHGVPFYVFDRRYAISGAQPIEVFLKALDMLTEEALEVWA
jgi:predicted DsbA family dithiol-disulfide isomerase